MSTKKGKYKKPFSELTGSVDHQLQQLPPSKELVAHYRAKLSALNIEYDDLSARVDECRALFEADARLQQELLQRNAEVSRLTQALSDLQVYVFKEREQALKLYAENDQLKLRQLEDRKKIDLLLSLSGTTEDEVTFLLVESSKRTAVIPQHQPSNKTRKTSVTKGSGDALKNNDSQEASDTEILALRVQSLKAQLAEQSQLYQDETAALLQDRELVKAERAADSARHQHQLEALTIRLQQSQKKVCDLTAMLVEAKREHRGFEAGWVSERDQLLRSLNFCKEQLGDVLPSGGTVVSGAGLRAARSCGELSVLKEQLTERDRSLAMYQEQCTAMEQEVTRLRDQAESSKSHFKDRIKKMAAQVMYLRNKYNELDRRRILEAEGFRTDIRLMRTRLRELERGFSKINLRSGASSSTARGVPLESAAINCGLVSTARDTVERARQLEQELKHIHNKVMSLESELKLTGESN